MLVAAVRRTTGTSLPLVQAKSMAAAGRTVTMASSLPKLFSRALWWAMVWAAVRMGPSSVVWASAARVTL
ncbi:MAG: hypothetical protein ACR2J8_06615 [Thermomicrobiales bacterium]